jgi:hypothetical protein
VGLGGVVVVVVVEGGRGVKIPLLDWNLANLVIDQSRVWD